MTILRGQIIGPPADSVRPENHARPTKEIEPHSRIRITVQDVSLMDAPSVQIACQEILTGPSGLSFPIAFEIPYDPLQIQGRHTYSVSARVTARGGAIGGCHANQEGEDEVLTWITMTRHTAAFQPSGMAPEGPVTIDVERV
ncbi:hypothetical protein DFQ26_006676 [Actinomortierella ambigua]|nr:hypothetical protein DFQ26_006676 [Actinomortierella ambigua]